MGAGALIGVFEVIFEDVKSAFNSLNILLNSSFIFSLTVSLTALMRGEKNWVTSAGMVLVNEVGMLVMALSL